MATRNKSAKKKSGVIRSAEIAKAGRALSIQVKEYVKNRDNPQPEGTIEPAKGKLGVMIPGMGAVATTFVAGVEPFLAAAPRTAGQVNLGSWNLDVSGGPEQ